MCLHFYALYFYGRFMADFGAFATGITIGSVYRMRISKKVVFADISTCAASGAFFFQEK